MSKAVLIEVVEDKELAQLQAQIREAEGEAAQLTLHLADLKLEIKRFQAEYSAHIGSLYVELDQVELEVREYQLRTELVRKGIDPDSDEINQKVEQTFQAEWERLSAYQERVHEDEQKQKEREAQDPEESKHLRSIYLHLAKRFHPDKAQDAEERQRNQRMMAIINQAYEEQDRATLERLESETPDVFSSDESPEGKRQRLRSQLERLRGSIAELKQEIEERRQSDVYLLKQQVEHARTRGEDLLARLTRDIQYKIASAKHRLRIVKNLFERWSTFLKGRTYGPR